MVHWLKFKSCDKEAYRLLKEFKEKHECKMQRYYCDTNMVWDYVRLECSQPYDELDLDCNSFSSPIYHLTRKPSNMIISRVQMEESFAKYAN